jgi:predicted DNA-binding transcriptional regulator YafY
MDKILKWSVENQNCIEMIYQNKDKKISQRIIKVLEIKENYISAYCYLRMARRIFNKDCILSVATHIKRSRKGA